jgi:hypothetical protein
VRTRTRLLRGVGAAAALALALRALALLLGVLGSAALAILKCDRGLVDKHVKIVRGIKPVKTLQTCWQLHVMLRIGFGLGNVGK